MTKAMGYLPQLIPARTRRGSQSVKTFLKASADLTATLIVLPAILALLQSQHAGVSASLDPDDPHSPYFEPEPRRAAMSDRARRYDQAAD